MKLRFSERQGVVEPSRAIQVGGMDSALRNSLWNVLDIALWSRDRFLWVQHAHPEIESFSRRLWYEYFKEPMDARPQRPHLILRHIRSYFFSAEWYEVYEFLEWVLGWAENQHNYRTLPRMVNHILERELAGYRFVDGVFTDITDQQEIESLEAALQDGDFPGVRAHLHSALRLLADRENPDYRNSIKESISAVESMAKAVTGNEKATLGEALSDLEKRGHLHGALRKGFSSLYGYTSDEGGIRHAMLEEPNLTPADAKYFLLSCTSFTNYLKAKL